MKTKIFCAIIFLIFVSCIIQAQDEGYVFTKVYEVPVTAVKNQFKSGTCWSFSGLSFIEAEILRTKKTEIILSTMWIVRHTYYEKAVRYIRFHGHNNFGAGGAFHDVTNIIEKYGIVPEEIYRGLNYGTDKHIHAEIDAVLKAYLDAIVKNPNKELTTSWLNGLNSILDAYFGPVPEKFILKGKEYTPKSFAAYLGIKPDEYVIITSFTHHPFYTSFVLEVPDNWAHDIVYNVPLNELEEIIDYSLKKGYAVAWASDVSEKGFSWKNGIAIVPEIKIDDLEGTERERWERLSEAEKEKELYKFSGPANEKIITQKIRQNAFDNYNTTDDHGMLINGIYTAQNGAKFYKVKNSWDVTNIYEGYLYASSAFVLYKTTNIMVHKNAVPKPIAKKLGL